MRCIETEYFISFDFSDKDKLQHEMYWNDSEFIKHAKNVGDKLQHEMYWNALVELNTEDVKMINYNMRCIETMKR